MHQITGKDSGKQCAFHGFDGKLYVGKIERVRRKVAVITYYIPRLGNVTTYLGPEHHSRIRLPGPFGEI